MNRTTVLGIILALVLAMSVSVIVPDDISAEGATYYVDADNGNDANSGADETQAWKTINKAMGSAQNGDTVMITGTFGSTTLSKMVTLKAYGEARATFTGNLGMNWGAVAQNSWQAVSGTLSMEGITFERMTLQDEGANLSYNLSTVTVNYVNCTFKNTNSAMSLVLYGDYSVNITGCKFIGTNMDSNNQLYTNSTYAVFANNCGSLNMTGCDVSGYTRGVNADSIETLNISKCEFTADKMVDRGTNESEIRMIQIAGSTYSATISEVTFDSSIDGNCISIHESLIPRSDVTIEESSMDGFDTGIVYQVTTDDGGNPEWASQSTVNSVNNLFKSDDTVVPMVVGSTDETAVPAEDATSALSSNTYYTTESKDAVAGSDQGASWTYNITTKTLTFTGSIEDDRGTWTAYETEAEHIVINSATEICDDAFAGWDKVKTVTFDSPGLTTVGDNAFEDCISLTSIEFPDSVTSLGQYVLSGCGSLESLKIPAGVTEIPYCMISNSTADEKSSLTSITIPAGITKINNYAFRYCTSLSEVVFEGDSELTSIGQTAFKGCTALTSITIPASVQSIGNASFEETGLRAVTFEEGSKLTSIGTTAFAYTDLTEIAIPSTVDTMYSTAFKGCTQLVSIDLTGNSTYRTDGSIVYNDVKGTMLFAIPGVKDIVIPDGYKEIPDSFFAYSAIESVVIPSTVASIGWQAFQGCSDLTEVEIVGNGLRYIDMVAFEDCTSLTELEIPDGVTEIDTSAFANSGIKTFRVPTTISEIQYGTFRECSNLESITIPSNITSIGDSAFSDCTSLREVILESDNITLGMDVFEGCTNLVSVESESSILVYNGSGVDGTYTISATVTYIADGAFTGSDLRKIVVEEGNPAFTSIDGILYDRSVKTLKFIPTNIESKVLTIPETVERIECSTPTAIDDIIFLCQEMPEFGYKDEEFWGSTERLSMRYKDIFAPDEVLNDDYMVMDSSMGNVIIFVWELPVIEFSPEGNSLTASIDYPQGDRNTNTGHYYQNDSLKAEYTWENGTTGGTTTLSASGLYKVSAEVSMTFDLTPESSETVTVTVEGEYMHTPAGTNTIQVNFKDGGETLSTINVEEGTVNQNLIPTPAKTGYDFAGWTLNNEEWNGAVSGTDQVDIIASWKLQAPTVYITADKTSPVQGETVTLTANPSHILSGVTYGYQWYTVGENDVTTEITGQTDSTLDVTEPGNYLVKITARNGVDSSDEVSSAPRSVAYWEEATVTVSVNGVSETITVPVGETLPVSGIVAPTGFEIAGYSVDDTVSQDPPVIEGDCTVIVQLSLVEPQVSIVASDTDPQKGDTVTLTVTIVNSGDGIQYTYKWGDGATGAPRDVTESGTYSVNVTASYGAKTESASASIDVKFAGRDVDPVSPPAGGDDDEDLPPIIRPGGSGSSSSDDDTVTIVACAAAAAVAAILAVFLIYAYRKD